MNSLKQIRLRGDFRRAVANGQMATIVALLQKGADPWERMQNGHPALKHILDLSEIGCGQVMRAWEEAAARSERPEGFPNLIGMALGARPYHRMSGHNLRAVAAIDPAFPASDAAELVQLVLRDGRDLNNVTNYPIMEALVAVCPDAALVQLEFNSGMTVANSYLLTARPEMALDTIAQWPGANLNAWLTGASAHERLSGMHAAQEWLAHGDLGALANLDVHSLDENGLTLVQRIVLRADIHGRIANSAGTLPVAALAALDQLGVDFHQRGGREGEAPWTAFGMIMNCEWGNREEAGALVEKLRLQLHARELEQHIAGSTAGPKVRL